MEEQIGLEEKVILEKFQTASTREDWIDGSATDSAQKYLADLHRNINVMQHHLAWGSTAEPESRGLKGFVKRTFRKLLRSSASAQTVYNEHGAHSLLYLTILSQNLCAKVDMIEQMVRHNYKALEGTQSNVNDLNAGLQDVKMKMMHSQGTGSGDPAALSSYSQVGEDVIIDYIVRMMGIPFSEITYLDLGANHAKLLSNTYHFYLEGASGVLLEANPALIDELERERPHDTVINKCIDTESGKRVKFYVLSGDGLSTTSLEDAQRFCAENHAVSIIDEIEVETICVSDIMKQYFAKRPPTILSIDIEGKEREILQSIDFKNGKPMIVIVEMIDYDKNGLCYESKNEELKNMIESFGYDEYAFTGVNSIFLNRDWNEKGKADAHRD